MDLSKKMKWKHFLLRVKQYFSDHWVGYFWFLLTLTFALIIPFIMRIVTSSEYTFIHLISDGNIVLFSMVIIASLMIDNFMFEEDFSVFLDKKNESEHSILIKRFLVFIFPLLMVMFCLIAYIGCINMSKEKIDAFVVVIELSTFFAIAAYAAHIKQLSWDKKKNVLTNQNKMINSH
jgi:hypothetical protein